MIKKDIMKKNIILGVLALVFSTSAIAQQIPFYKQYFVNPFVYNPSMAGTGDRMNLFLINRSQFGNIGGGPTTNAMTLDGPITQGVNGFGLNFFVDRQDMFTKTSGNLAYSHKLLITENHRLNLGGSIGIIDNKVDFSKAVVTDNKDPYLFGSPQNKSHLNGSFGATYLWDKVEAGFAIAQIGRKKTIFTDNFNQATYTSSMHYITSAKYTFTVSEELGIKAYPLVLMRFAPNTPVQFDVNAVVNYQEKVWAAASYSRNYAYSFSAGVKLYDMLTLGYSYDILASNIRGTGVGRSSEIIVGITFGGKNNVAKTNETKLADSDNDGIPDIYDLEPETEEGALVNFQGRTIRSANESAGKKVDTVIVIHEFANSNIPAVQSAIFFDTDKWNVKSGFEDQFVIIANALKKDPKAKVTISGYTDSRGSVAYNENLGQKRAQEVAKYLTKNYGIAPNRMVVTISKGKKELLSLTHHSINRRVDLVVE